MQVTLQNYHINYSINHIKMRQLKINKSITNRSEESLDKYLTEISRVPMVTTEEEVLLAQAIHAGGKKGEKAKERLVTANLRRRLPER